jgi:Polysaccharide pyruvyl transferase
VTVLVAGWFSFEGMGATAGDLLVRDVACAWLDEARRSYAVATAPPFTGGVDWRTVEPREYEQVVFVCGPFGNGPPVDVFLERFSHARLTGLNLSMLDSLDAWDVFDALWERDSTRTARPDLALLSTPSAVPVVGVVLVHPQKEYAGGVHAVAEEAVDRLFGSRELAAVRIDTRLDDNVTGLRTPDEVASLIARMDAVVTTRLHGLVLALKRGVPALAIDPVAGGAKVLRQAQAIGWPVVYTADALADDELRVALDYCLTAEAQREAELAAQRGIRNLAAVRDEFIASLAGSAPHRQAL